MIEAHMTPEQAAAVERLGKAIGTIPESRMAVLRELAHTTFASTNIDADFTELGEAHTAFQRAFGWPE